jgi:hypothetical protein
VLLQKTKPSFLPKKSMKKRFFFVTSNNTFHALGYAAPTMPQIFGPKNPSAGSVRAISLNSGVRRPAERPLRASMALFGFRRRAEFGETAPIGGAGRTNPTAAFFAAPSHRRRAAALRCGSPSRTLSVARPTKAVTAAGRANADFGWGASVLKPAALRVLTLGGSLGLALLAATAYPDLVDGYHALMGQPTTLAGRLMRSAQEN